MRMIYLMKIINRYSLTFAIINFLMANMGYENQNSFLFIWICFISFCVIVLRDIKSNKIFMPVLAAFYPLAGIRNLNDFLVIAIILAYSMYFIFKENAEIEYDLAVDEIKKSSVILLVFILLSLLSFNIDLFERVSWYYIVIYIISSVFYLRVMRSVKFGYDSSKNKDANYINPFEKKYKRVNYVSSVIMCSVTVVISIRSVRDVLVKALSFSYEKFVDIFIYLFTWFFLIIGNIMMFIMYKLRDFIARAMGRYDSVEESMENSSYNKIPQPKNLTRDSIADFLSKNPYALAALKILVLAVVMYIVFRIIKSKANKNKINEDFIESREYIKENNKGNLHRIKNIIRIKSNEEYIRHHYKNFMKESIGKGISIEKSDTTADIHEKAKYSFNREALENMRKFYINARYGNAGVDKASLKLFNSYYRNLKK